MGHSITEGIGKEDDVMEIFPNNSLYDLNNSSLLMMKSG
jgi:hypothetical protein